MHSSQTTITLQISYTLNCNMFLILIFKKSIKNLKVTSHGALKNMLHNPFNTINTKQLLTKLVLYLKCKFLNIMRNNNITVCISYTW